MKLRSNYKTPEERVQQIAPLAAQGKTARQIAPLIGCKHAHVSNVAREYGIKLAREPRRVGLRPGAMLHEERLAQILALNAAGYNRHQIAERIGLSHTRIGIFLMRAGVTNIPHSGVHHANVSRVATETVNILVGAATGLGLFRNGRLAITQELATELLPDLREAMRSLRRFEKAMKEMANGRDREAPQQDPVRPVQQDEDRGGSAEALAPPAHEQAPR